MATFPSAFRPGMAVLLSILLASPAVRAQQAAAPLKLNIAIVEGEGAINNVRQRVAREPIVQVTDENNKPVAGAAVTFLLPNSGPGGTFPGGQNSMTVITDAEGKAQARGLRANRMDGKYQMRVTVSFQGVTSSTTIGMSNIIAAGTAAGAAGGAGGGMSLAKILLVVAIMGGAAAGGITAATSGNSVRNDPPPGTRTTITPGTPNVGPPR